jgi:hypothetical protein
VIYDPVIIIREAPHSRIECLRYQVGYYDTRLIQLNGEFSRRESVEFFFLKGWGSTLAEAERKAKIKTKPETKREQLATVFPYEKRQ